MIETAKYRITGIVDKFDEQMNIIGAFEVGSVQELPVEVGTKLVAEGRAEAVAEGGDVVHSEGDASEDGAPVGAQIGVDPAVEGGDTTVSGNGSEGDGGGDSEDDDGKVE